MNEARPLPYLRWLSVPSGDLKLQYQDRIVARVLNLKTQWLVIGPDSLSYTRTTRDEAKQFAETLAYNHFERDPEFKNVRIK
jgi:hypothetical protein